MSTAYYENAIEGYTRTIYNAIITSSEERRD